MALQRRIAILAALAIMTTVLADDDTTAAGGPDDPAPASDPAPAPEPRTIAAEIMHALMNQLRPVKFPWIPALVAAIFGLGMLFKGKVCFQHGMTFAFGAAFGLLAKTSARGYWNKYHAESYFHQEYCEDFIGMLAFVIAALGAHYGHKGLLIAIGAGMGFTFAFQLQDFIVQIYDQPIMHKAEVQAFWFTIWTALGVGFFLKERHNCIVALVAPVIGGASFSSAFWYGITEVFAKFGCHDGSFPGQLTPQTGAWVDFFNQIFNAPRSDDEDFGLFHASRYNFKLGRDTPWHLDNILMVAFWVILALIGIKIQMKGLKSNNKKEQTKSTAKAKAKARESLQEALIQNV